MSLKCQKDSYLRSYRSRVASCRPAENVGNGEGKYEVVLDDTVLFPEGGGQPYDRGTINGVEVLRVLRRGAVAVHFTEEPLEEGAEVEMEVDWNRRFDHMQQHSGNTNILVMCINPVSAIRTPLEQKKASILLRCPCFGVRARAVLGERNGVLLGCP
jgi:Ser-tRNA(Ala) deacylase AlaX